VVNGFLELPVLRPDVTPRSSSSPYLSAFSLFLFSEDLMRLSCQRPTSATQITYAGNCWTYPTWDADRPSFFAYNNPSWVVSGQPLINWALPPQIQPVIQQVPTGTSQEQCDVGRPSTGHNVCLICMADGSVRDVNGRHSQQTWQSAILPGDGIPLGSDW
jgi:hypothetical protein